jgi:cell division protein FtsW (lipid II flippase)
MVFIRLAWPEKTDTRSRFHVIKSLGLVCMLAFQTFLAIGGNLKLIPHTGVTQPFLSYGGSSILVSMLMVGLLSKPRKKEVLENG